jgi:hypothetical protein
LDSTSLSNLSSSTCFVEGSQQFALSFEFEVENNRLGKSRHVENTLVTPITPLMSGTAALPYQLVLWRTDPSPRRPTSSLSTR